MLLPEHNALDQYASIFKKIGGMADALNLEIYLIGGFVRDIFLQRESKDIDILISTPLIRDLKDLKRRGNDLTKEL